MGEFRGIVKIDNYEFGRGFHQWEPHITANMKLEGRLIEFGFGDAAKKVKKKVEVSLDIQFTEQQEIDDSYSKYAKEDKKYIGHIRTIQPSGPMNYDWVDVWITLPYDMFSQIRSVGKREIVFRAIYDQIAEPEEPNEDHCVALIERVYFSENL